MVESDTYKQADFLAEKEQPTQEGFLARVEALVKKGTKIAIAADFDENISLPKEGSSGVDPRDGQIHPQIRHAFQDILASGRDVVIVSSRGGQDIRRIADLDGISIVGTLGWETVDKEGNSHIHPQFRPYQPQITGILQDVRTRFFTEQLLKRDAVLAQEPNSELLTPDGELIVLQRKGYNDEYKEGINATWSLSMVGEQNQLIYQQALQQYYDEAFMTHTQQFGEEEKAALEQLCGFMLREGVTAQGKKTLDIEIRPTAQGAKADAILQLLNTDNSSRIESFTHMPTADIIIFSGDHPKQDFAAMQAGHEVLKASGGERGVLGVWSRSPHETQTEIPEGVDIVVDSVSGNAALLTSIAHVMEEHPVAS